MVTASVQTKVAMKMYADSNILESGQSETRPFISVIVGDEG